ncbi:MAG: ATP-dependent DNA helicase RecG [Pseudomonadota bacterium]|nr:ATP-dependent DNA helicase RecG [Pseudomonadota bacterium]
MRPEILFPLFSPVTTLDGVGPRIAKLIEKLKGPNVVDLLWHFPNGLIDRRNTPKIINAAEGLVATLTVHIDQHFPAKTKRVPYKILCSDETGTITLIFFHAKESYLQTLLPIGEKRIISGVVERYGDNIQMAHPDHVVKIEDRADVEIIEPLYPLTQGLSQKVLNKAIKNSLNSAESLPEWLDKAYLIKQKWPNWATAISNVHTPNDETDFSPGSINYQRLAYDELLANQLALALIRIHTRKKGGRPITGNDNIKKKIISALPFDLTNSQVNAVRDITKDMSGDGRMHRLLQGDVGSGKTIVALLSMIHAIESGAQAALLAPTEILARQHLTTIEPLTNAVGVNVALLTAREKGKKRESIIEGYDNGSIDIAIGTHAIFQEGINFKNLAFTVIDEQHRFGVEQRLALTSKGQDVDILVMTATPIPRTLELTAYGDMEVSRLTEKPPGRLPIDTRTIANNRITDVIEGLGRALSEKKKVYWVCPLIEESEKIDLAAAEDRFSQLKSIFGERVGLVHGKMNSAEKDSSMESFINGNVDILIATTVIEVGVDVPEASIMIIEHAERFGLAQLHQLRGRIGRGSNKSICILLFSENLTKVARKRLNIMRNTEDGFVIADEDLSLRGAGEILGTRQSGLPEFKIVDLNAHSELVLTARNDAKLILEKDPELKTERGKNLRVLLHLFERNAAVKFLRSG